VRWGNVAVLILASAVVFAAPAFAFDPEAATKAYLATVNGAARARSDAYFEGGYWFILWDALAVFGASLLVFYTRLGAGVRSFVAGFIGYLPLQTFVVAVLIQLLLNVLTLPLDYYQGFVREHAYNLSTQTVAAWASDTAIAAAAGAILLGLLLAVIFAVIRRAPRNWWVISALVFGLFIAFAGIIGPVALEPLLNKFTPMEDGPLKASILSIAKANGVPANNVYVFDTSRQSTRITAHVSGLFGTTRVSLGDNLIKRGTPEEVRAVMGHELGHYVLNHSWFLIAWQTLGAIFGFGIIAWIYNGMLANGAAGVKEPGDPAGIPLFIAIATVLGFLATPLSNTLTRTIETQADYFGLNAAQEPDGFAKAALDLSTYRKLEPTPFEEFVFYDHPSGYNRIHRAMIWKAEHYHEPTTIDLSAPAPPAAAPAQTEVKTAPALAKVAPPTKTK
jgi:STE24 endopeptidase